MYIGSLENPQSLSHTLKWDGYSQGLNLWLIESELQKIYTYKTASCQNPTDLDIVTELTLQQRRRRSAEGTQGRR